MTVTREQAQMLTTLAIAGRLEDLPRAPTWDAAGLMAAIAKRRDGSLLDLMLRIAVAAADREAYSPGVIASPGMQIPETKPPLFKPTPWDPNAICTTCSRPEAQCKAVRHAGDDHEFVSRAANAQQTERPAEAVARIVTSLREHAADEPPVRPEPETSSNGTTAVQPARAALAATRETPSAANVAGNEE